MAYQTIDESWTRHFTKNSDGVLVNSRHTKFELAPYEVSFMNYIFSRPLIASRQPESEISKQKYYYAVVNGKDFDLILTHGRLPVGREHYYPLNWSTNRIEALRFMDYLIRFDYEKKEEGDE